MRSFEILSACAMAAALCASTGALAQGALGKTFKFAGSDVVAAADCTSRGGVVSATADGNKSCKLPLTATSLKFAANDAIASADCKATGGVVTTAGDGNMLCTKTAPAPAPTREPHN